MAESEEVTDNKNVIPCQVKAKDEEVANNNSHVPQYEIKAKDVVDSLMKNTNIAEVLKEFLRLAELYEKGESSYNIIEEYLQISGTCSEFLSLIDITPDHVLKDLHAYESLQKILLYMADKQQVYSKLGLRIVKHITENYMHRFRRALQGNAKSGRIKSVLKLLTAMVMIGTEAAREVMNTFSFQNEHLPGLLKRTDMYDSEDVRTCFVHFIVAFLMTDDSVLIQQLIQIKEFLTEYFEGLPGDRSSVICLFLKTLQKQVVENKTLSKTLKIRLLNDRTLNHVIKLYSWTGPKRHKGKKRKLSDEDGSVTNAIIKASQDEIFAVRQVVQDFLLATCCSRKTGILFNDPAMGTGNKNLNHVMTRILTSIEAPYADELKSQLVIKILQASPDQVKFYLPTLQNSLIPRPSENWVQAITFMSQIVSSQEAYKVIFTDSKKPINKLVSLTSISCIPVGLKHSEFEEHLQSGQMIVKHYLLDYICSILRKVLEIIEFCNTQPSLQYTEMDLQEFIHLLKEAIRVRLPDASAIVHPWFKLEEFIAESQISGGFPNVTVGQYVRKLLEALALYNNTFGAVKDLLPISTLLHGINAVLSQMDENGIIVIKEQLLKLLSVYENNTLLFNEKDGETSAFKLFLNLYVSSDVSKIKKAMKSLVEMMLQRTGYFETCHWEMEIWLNNLHTKPLLQEKLLDFFIDATKNLVKDGPTYLSVVSECLKDFDHDVSKKAKYDAASHGHQFSALIPSALTTFECTSEYSNIKEFQKYISKVLKEILHRQHYPEALSALIAEKCSCVTKDLKMYSQIWLGDGYRNQESPKKQKKDWCLSEQLQLLFTMTFGSDDPDTQKWFKKFKATSFDVTPQELYNVTFQTLSYLGSELKLIQRGAQGSKEKVEFYLGLLQAIMNNFSSDKNSGDVKCKREEKSFSITIQDDEQFKERDDQHSLWQSCLIAVLSHPAIKDCFLFFEDASVSKEAGSLCNYLVTSFAISQIRHLENILSSDHDKFLQVFRSYKEKTLEYLQIHGKYFFDPHSPYIEILKIAINYVDMNDVICITKSLSSVVAHSEACDMDSLLMVAVQCIQYAKDKNEQLPVFCILPLFQLYSRSGNIELGCYLKDLLCQAPDYCKSVPLDFIKTHVRKPLNAVCFELLEIVYKHSIEHLNFIQEQVKKNVKKMKLEPAGIVQLIHTCICCSKEGSDNLKFMKSISQYYYEAVSNIILQSPASVKSYLWQSGRLHKTLQKLISGGALGLEAVKSLFEEILNKGVAVWTLENLQGIWQLCLCLEEMGGDLSVNPRMAIVKMYLTSISDQLQVKHENESNLMQAATDCLSILQDTPHVLVAEVLTADEVLWPKVAMSVLKRGLRSSTMGPQLLQLLRKCCESIQDPSSLNLNFATLYQMILGHSRFLKIMLDETLQFADIKDSLADLLITLAIKEPKVCQTEHIPIFLSSYHATLSRTDQKLLHLLYLYGNNGANMFEYRPFLWGSMAVSLYSVKQGMSLWNEPKMEDVTALLQEDKLIDTALNFPLNFSLEPQVIPEDVLLEKHNIKDPSALYDPRFLLPLLDSLLAPEAYVQCRTFLESKCLAVVFASLSSKVDDVRLVGYHLLTSFYQHLEGYRSFKDRLFWMGLLDKLKNSITKPNHQLPCITTALLIRVMEIMSHPDHPLYSPLYRFMLSKAVMDVHNINEAFSNLFYSNELQHLLHRNWIVSLLVDGMRTYQDFIMCTKYQVLDRILCHAACSISDSRTKASVCRLLKKIVQLSTTSDLLIKKYGLLAWIRNFAKSCADDPTTASEMWQIYDQLSSNVR